MLVFDLYLAIPALYLQQMAVSWAIFATFVLVVLHIPLMEGYRDGARQESCYNMLVEHENSFAPPESRIVPPQMCPDPCFYNMTVIAQVDEETRMRIPEANLSTYQCGTVYESKWITLSLHNDFIILYRDLIF